MSLYKILLVDDEEEVRTSIIRKIQWQELGYEVVGDAENGEEALEKARQLTPDLILTDIKMPYMDGLTLAEKIKKERSSTEIVIFSGFDDFEYAKQAIKLNVIEYILKPVNVEELTEILRRLKLKMDERIAEMRNVEALRENYRRMLPTMKEHFLTDVLHDKKTPEDTLEGFRRFAFFGGSLSDGEETELSDRRWAAAVAHIELPEQKNDDSVISLHRERELIPLSVQHILRETLVGGGGGLCRLHYGEWRLHGLFPARRAAA